MVREFSEKEKKVEPGHPAFSLCDPMLDAQAKAHTLPDQEGNSLTQLDKRHLQITMQNGKCWDFELNKPAKFREDGYLFAYALKSFTDPQGTSWQNKDGAWIGSTPSGPRSWPGQVDVRLFRDQIDATGFGISFHGQDGLHFSIGNSAPVEETLVSGNSLRFAIKGVRQLDGKMAEQFKKDVLGFLPKLNQTGAIDKAELNADLKDRSVVGLKAVVLAALDENFSDIAGLDARVTTQPTQLTKAALDKFDSLCQSYNLQTDNAQSKKIIDRVSDSLRNGYFDLAANGPDKPLMELRQEATDEITRLHQQYKIDLASPGERLFLDQSFPIRKDYPAYLSSSRTPRLFELRLIEAAVQQSQPSQLSKDGKQGIKLYFLNDIDIPGAAAFWNSAEKDKRQFMAIQPNRFHDTMAELKRIYMHELVHNSQYNRGWFDSPTFIAPPLSKGLQWLGSSLPLSNDQTSARLPVLGKLTKDLFYCSEPELDRITPAGKTGKEIATSIGWQLDKNGKVVGLKAVDDHVYMPTAYGNLINWQSVDSKFPCLQIVQVPGAMQQLAIFGTATTYFANPLEMFAENMKLYRDHSQAELSAQMLQVIKQEDQAEINQVYGITEDGQAKRMRNDDGILIGNPSLTPTACRERL